MPTDAEFAAFFIGQGGIHSRKKGNPVVIIRVTFGEVSILETFKERFGGAIFPAFGDRTKEIQLAGDEMKDLLCLVVKSGIPSVKVEIAKTVLELLEYKTTIPGSWRTEKQKITIQAFKDRIKRLQHERRYGERK